MGKFIINETEPNSDFSGFPNTNIAVEADKYEERGSFTVFLDGDGLDVFSMKTAAIETGIRRVE